MAYNFWRDETGLGSNDPGQHDAWGPLGIADPFNLTGHKYWNDYNTAGRMPQMPAYQAAYDPNAMSMESYMKKNYDPRAMQAFSEQALRKGPSAWANMAQQQNAQQTAAGREKAATQANAQTAQSMDRLAATGGLSSGARERAGIEGAKNYMAMSQDLGRQSGQNKLQISMNDEQNRIQQLGMLPGMEAQKAGIFGNARAGDIRNTLDEANRLNQYNMNAYGQQMQAWGGNKAADATLNAGQHGGFLSNLFGSIF